MNLQASSSSPNEIIRLERKKKLRITIELNRLETFVLKTNLALANSP